MQPLAVTSRQNEGFRAMRQMVRRPEPDGPFFLLEGKKHILTALSQELVCHTLWACGDDLDRDPDWQQLVRQHDMRLRQLPSDLFSQLSLSGQSQGWVAQMQKPWHRPPTWDEVPGTYLLLDRLQDPGNAGSLLRAAAAFGLRGVFWNPPHVSPFHPLVSRGAAGHTFHLQHFHWPKDDAPARQLPLIIADLQGEPLNARFHWPRHFILALGNEGSGVGTVLRSSAHHRVTISHAAEVESLNVSGAAHILLYSADQWLSKST